MRATLLAFAVLLCGCGRTETFPAKAEASAVDAGGCALDAGTPEVSESRLPDQTPLTWRADACINVSYDVGLEVLLPDLREALADWSFPRCTWICFTAPTAGGAPPSSTDRRIHFAPGGNDPNDGNVSLTQTDGAEITGVSISIGRRFIAPGKAPLRQLIGGALGFVATPSVDTVLNDDMTASSLTPADEQSVCALYPSCR